MLASTVGISNPHMSNIERGKTKVSLATLIDIANALDTTFDALICDNLVKGKVVFDEEISQELEECSEEDIRIVYDMVKALVKSLAKRKSKMAEREKYYIGLNGQIFEVSKELYETYYKGQRKEKYFTHDLKQEHTKVDKETGEMIVIPSREDSYERLLEAEKQFAEETEKVEDVAVRAVMLE